MEPELSISSKEVYRGKVVNLRIDKVKLGKGAEALREIVEHSPSVVIVPIDTKGNVLLVKQYRKPAEEFLLEAPAGSMEAGEDPERCALRELEEETGYTALEVIRMGGFWMSPGFCTEFMHAFIAQGLKPAPSNPDEDEEIQVVPVPLEKVPGLIGRGEIKDAKSIAALLMAFHLYEDKVSR